MVSITEIPYMQHLHVMGSERYSIRDTQIHDDVAGRFVTADDIAEDMTEGS